MLFQVGIYVVFKVGIGFNTIDMFDKRSIITMNLIAWPRAQFKNDATSGLYERGNNGCVLVSNEIASCAWWSVYSVHALSEGRYGEWVRLQVILSNFAEAASRICRRRPSAVRPSRQTACVKASQCTVGEGWLVELEIGGGGDKDLRQIESQIRPDGRRMEARRPGLGGMVIYVRRL